MPIVIAPPRLIALGTLRLPARIGAPSATIIQGIHDGISSQCLVLLLSFEPLIARMVANQPMSATRIAPATLGEIICTLLRKCCFIVADLAAWTISAAIPLVLFVSAIFIL